MGQRIKHEFVERVFVITHLEVIRGQRPPRSMVHKNPPKDEPHVGRTDKT